MIKRDIIINSQISLLDALNIMDQTTRKLLIVCEFDNFKGVISIGDVQRAIIKKQDLSLPVYNFVRKKVTYALTTDDLESVKNRMREEKIESMPVVDSNGVLCDVIEWAELFPAENEEAVEQINLPVVIMAGGKGTRLLPLTNVIPKPLIPVSDKTIMEEIMMRFKKAGCEEFYVSVNYMVETIKEYFSLRPEWSINYIQEKKPLGTGGSLYLLKNKINKTFFVTNCDTIIDINLYDLLNYHKSNNNLITVVSAVKTLHIPYGTIETKVDGVISRMKEKPDLVYQINSGFYVLEPEVLQYVEDEEFMNIPDLIGKLIDKGKRVGAFPVSENSWTDMGNWEEYLKLINHFLK
ncbi:MAG: nucleotidyltransferase family protein [Saccharofermentans sp.]|nr:nucleotidyltransferase family protein [Saccharofermentans sp.]